MSQSDQAGLLTRFSKQLSLLQPLQKVKAMIKHKKTRNKKETDQDGNKVDRISCLPNDILCRIISFLPFESAVQTSLLSIRWKNLWKMALVKDGTKQEAAFDVLNFLNDFSEFHQPRNNWGLQYNFGQGRVLLVAVAPKGILHLDFSAGKQSPRQFRLSLGRKREIYCHQPSLYITFILRSLHLVSVSYVSTEMVSCLLSNIPFLESLTIAKCCGLQTIQLEGNSKLQKLTVLDCLQLESIQVHFNSQFSLYSFRCRGRVVSFKCYNEDPLYYWYNSPVNDDCSPFDLEDAMLDFRQGPGYCGINIPGFKSMLQSIRGVKTLTLCRWVFQDLILPELYLLGEGFFKLTELWWIDDSQGRCSCNALIFFLKLCPQLNRLYITIDPNSHNTSYSTSISLSSIKLDRPTELKHLKAVKLEGFANEEEEIMVAKQLKEIFQAEPLVIKWDGTVRRLTKVDDQGIGPYGFVEQRVENLHELCPKHVHMDL
ncbi:hypothetical protein PTKIN_Ptkin13bG0184200 [Pterospermum kingtungense]